MSYTRRQPHSTDLADFYSLKENWKWMCVFKGRPSIALELMEVPMRAPVIWRYSFDGLNGILLEEKNSPYSPQSAQVANRMVFWPCSSQSVYTLHLLLTCRDRIRKNIQRKIARKHGSRTTGLFGKSKRNTTDSVDM